MVLMRKIIDETFLFQLGFALSLGFMGIQEATGTNLWGLSMVLMMEFLLGSLSPGPGLHGARSSKLHYLLVSENPRRSIGCTKLHQSFSGRSLGAWQSPGWCTHLPRRRRPRYKPHSSQTFLCIFTLWFSSLVTFARANLLLGSTPGWARRGARQPDPDWGKQPQGSVYSHHPSVRNHHFTELVKGTNVKAPTLLAEVRVVFQHSLPRELALPCGQPRHGTPWKRFSRKVKQGRTEQTEGCVWSQPHSRQGAGWLMCKQALRSSTPQHVTGAQACLHQEPPAMPPQCHQNATCFHEIQTDPQLPQHLHSFKWKEEEQKFKKKEEWMITWSFWHNFFFPTR